jgi:hypothetical protein
MGTTSPIQTWIRGDRAVAKERFQRLLVEQFEVGEKNTPLLTRTQFLEEVKK